MKLTPRCQGRKFRKPLWGPGEYLHIRHIGKPYWNGIEQKRAVEAVDENGRIASFNTSENEADWEVYK